MLALVIILLAGLVHTGLAVQQEVYVDPESGIQVIRSTPEYTVLSYYELLNQRSYDSAYRLYTAKTQRTTSPNEFKSQVQEQSSDTNIYLFPGRRVSNIAAVQFIRDFSVRDGKRQDILETQLLVKDAFGSRWSIARSLNEVPQRLWVELFQGLVEMDKSNNELVAGLAGLAPEQKASIKRQLTALTNSHEAQLLRIKDYLANGIKQLDTVEPEKEFIKQYAPRSSYIFKWREPVTIQAAPKHNVYE